jgi:hypothetical protein
MRGFVVSLIVFALCSCATSWEKYPMSLYSALKAETPDAIVAHQQLLEDMYMTAERANKKPPPGIAAEYAYYSWMLGKTEQAERALARERVFYPESAKFCDLLERFAASITPLELPTSGKGKVR